MSFTSRACVKWALLAMALVITTYFLSSVYLRALNIPYQDDVLDILLFLLRFTAVDNVREQLGELFSVYNTHRTASSRILYYGIYRLHGQVDFQVFTLVANLALPLIAVCYSRIISLRKDVFLALLIAALVLCQPFTYELVFFPVAAFSFYFLVLYALACLLLIERQTLPGLCLAMLSACMASLTLVSGLSVWLVGGLYVSYQVFYQKDRRPLHVFIWFLAALVLLVVFFSDFSGSQTAGGIWHGILQRPQHQLAYFFVLAGSGIGFGAVGVSLTAGFLLVSGLGWLVYRDCKTGLSSLHFFALFLLLSLIMVCLGRATLAELDYTTHRYAFLSRNLLLCFALLLLARLRSALPKLLVMLIMVAFWTVSYYFSVPQLERQMAFRVKNFNAGKYPVFYYAEEETKEIVNEAIQRGIYVPPERPLQVYPQ